MLLHFERTQLIYDSNDRYIRLESFNSLKTIFMRTASIKRSFGWLAFDDSHSIQCCRLLQSLFIPFFP